MRPEDITAVVLCGGRGSRLGNAAKPLLRLGDRMLVEHVIEALRPQVGGFVLACGRDRSPYASLGHPVALDPRADDGPLGGIAGALPLVTTAWLLVHPGDAPFTPPDLVVRLATAAEASGAAVPVTGEQRQNLVLLLSRERAHDLARHYHSGGRAVKGWLDAEGVEPVDMTDVAEAFLNVNTAADLEAARRRLAADQAGPR